MIDDTDSIAVGSVGGTVGIQTGNPGTGGSVTINAISGTITVSQPIDTNNGTGGGIFVSGSVNLNASLTAAGGNITLNGSTSSTSDIIVNFPLISSASIVLSAPRDIIVNALVQTTGAGSDITLTADAQGVPDGVGGVRISTAGQVNSADQVTISGSDLFVTTTGGPDSVEVQSDGATVQVLAVGSIVIQDGLGAPIGAQMLINGRVQATGAGSSIQITAEGTVSFSLDGDVIANNGAVTVTADTRSGDNSGDLLQANGAEIQAGNGLITLTADDMIVIGLLQTTGEVRVTTVNGLMLDADTTGTDIIATTAVLRAKTSIALDNNGFETQLGTLAAVTNSGDIFVANTGALVVGVVNGLVGVTITDVSNQNARVNNITLTASSPLTVNSPIANLDGGNITLTATNDGGNDDHLTISANLTVTGGDATIDSDGNITLTAGTDLIINNGGTLSTDASGTIIGTAVRSASVSAASTLQTVDGTLTLSANQAMVAITGNFNGVTVDASTITTSNGAMSLLGKSGDTAGNDGVVIQGGSSVAVTGTTGTITVTGAAVATTSSDGVVITGAATKLSSSGGLIAVTGSATVGDDGIEITQSDITATSSAGITLSGTTTGAAADSDGLVINGGGLTVISAVDGAVQVTGTGSQDDGVDLSSTQVSTSGTGSVTVLGSNGLDEGIDLVSTQISTSSSGNITLTGTGGASGGGGSIGVSFVGATTQVAATGSGSIAITGTGGTANSAGINLPSTVTKPIDADGAGSITLTGDGTGTSAGVQIDTEIESGSGAVTISSADDIRFAATGLIDSASNTVTMTADTVAGNNGGLISMANGAQIAGGSGAVVLSSDGTVALGRIVTTSSINVSSSSGSVLDAANNADIDLEGSSLTVAASGTFGAADNDDIDTKVGSLTVTTGGAQFINESDSLTAVNLSANSGAASIDLEAGGSVTDSDVSVDILANNLVADIAGAVTLDTTIATLDLSATAAGAIDIDETNAITLTDVDTANGSINIEATAGTITATDVESITDSDANDIALVTTASGDILVTRVTAKTTGDVLISAAGAITDNNAAATRDVVGDDAILSAGSNSVGISGDVLEVSITNLEGAAIGYFLNNDQALQIGGNAAIFGTNLSGLTSTGTVRITNKGSVSTTDDILTLTESISATGQLVVLTADGVRSNSDDASASQTIDITAANLLMVSSFGIGTLADSVEINATSNLAFTNTGPGDVIVVDSTGGLTIDDVDGVTASTNSAAGGAIFVSSLLGPLTVAHNLTAQAAVLLRTTDAATLVEHLVVTSGTTVSSATNLITLQVADNLTVQDTAVLQAATTITITADFGNADSGTGSLVTINGTLNAAATSTITCNSDADQFVIFPKNPDNGADTDSVSTLTINGGDNADQYTIHIGGLNGGATDVTLQDTGASGTDSALIYNCSAADGSAGTPLQVHNNVANGGTQTGGFVNNQVRSERVGYTQTLEQLEVRGDEATGGSATAPAANDAADYFDVQPSQTTRIVIHGNDPQFDNLPGDTLNVSAFGNAYSVNGNEVQATGGSPSTFLPITFHNIESIPLAPIPAAIPANSYSYDFNILNDVTAVVSPTQAGYLLVLPNTIYGQAGNTYGWRTSDLNNPATFPVFNVVDRGALTSTFSDLMRDGHVSDVAQVFKANIANNGWYMVSVKATDSLNLKITDADTGLVVVPDADLSGAGEVGFMMQITDGTLDLQIESGSGIANPWEINGIDLRPAAPFTSGVLEPNNVVADGATIDTYTGTGATPNALITVSGGVDVNGDATSDVSLSITSADVDSALTGVQVQANGAGQWSYSVRRPTAIGTAYITSTEFAGTKNSVQAIEIGRVSTRRFDFNVGSSPTQAPVNGFPVVIGTTEVGGYIGVNPLDLNLKNLGYAWASVAKSTDLASYSGGTQTNLLRDVHQGDGGSTGANTFSMQLANGTYLVNVTSGHPTASMSSLSVTAEGNSVLSSLSTAAGIFRSDSFTVTVTDGQLDLGFSAVSGWSLAGLEVRLSSSVPANAVTIDTFDPAGAPPAAVVPPAQNVTADGASIDTVNGTAPANAIITVSTTLGTITSADISSAYDGIQIQASAGGTYSFTLQRPAVSGQPTISVSTINGTGSTSSSAVVSYQLVAGNGSFFDFNGTSSPTETGYIGVTSQTLYSATAGYGWVTNNSPAEIDAGAVGGTNFSNLLRDTNTYGTSRTFRADLAAGAYEVTVIYGGTAATSNDSVSIAIGTGSGLTGLSSDATQFNHRRFTVNTAVDGGFNAIALTFDNADASPWSIAGLIFRPVAAVATNLTVSVVGGTLTADGTTVDAYSVGNLTAGRTYTISTTAGTITSADGDARFGGNQFVATGASQNFSIRRPALAASAAIQVEEVTGAQRGSNTQAFGIATSRRFDFGTDISPVAPGYIGVPASTSILDGLGYGWNAEGGLGGEGGNTNGYDRGTVTGVTTTSLFRDGAIIQAATTFQVSVASATLYDLRVYFGDKFNATQVMIAAEGTTTVTTATLALNTFGNQFINNASDTNGDGYIDITFTAGTAAGVDAAYVNGFDIAVDGTLPAASALLGAEVGLGTAQITDEDLAPIVAAAISRYETLGVSGAALAHLRNVTFAVQDLEGGTLGLAGSGRIVIDSNAAGIGWFVDATPLDDSEFAESSGGSELAASANAARGKFDLLTVVMHELGHELGLDDLRVGSEADDLMTEELSTGTRRLADLDAVFAANDWQ